jgi:hypothetical protein
MNERIRQLAEQACFDEIGKDYSLYFNLTKDKVEKFAQLIVQECIDTVSDCSVEYCTRPQIVSEIKEHFGVEE